MYNLKEEWKTFLRKIYSNALEIERKSYLEIEESFKTGKPFTDRKRLVDKIEWIISYKKKIVESASNKHFNLYDDTPIIIDKNGYEHYFRIYESLT